MPSKPRSNPKPAPGLPTHRAILAPRDPAPVALVRVCALRTLFLAERIVQPGEVVTLTPAELHEWRGCVQPIAG